MDRDRFRTGREIAAKDMVRPQAGKKPVRRPPVRTPVNSRKSIPKPVESPAPPVVAPAAPTKPKPVTKQPAKPAPKAAPTPDIEISDTELFTPDELMAIAEAELEPKRNLPKPNIKLPGKRLAIGFASVLFLLAAIGGVYMVLKPAKQVVKADSGLGDISSSLSVSKQTTQQTTSVTGAIPYTPIVPKDKPQLGKLGASAYTPKYQSYTFDDTYLGKPIRVSEQPIPANQTPSDIADKTAAALKAQTSQPFTNSQTNEPAFLLNNINQSSKQVVLFTIKNMLFFIQANDARDSTTWQGYLNSF